MPPLKVEAGDRALETAREIYDAQCDNGRTFDNALSLEEIAALIQSAMNETERELREALKDRDKCSFIGPMRDCPTHGESQRLKALHQVLSRLVIAWNDESSESQVANDVLAEAERLLAERGER